MTKKQTRRSKVRRPSPIRIEDKNDKLFEGMGRAYYLELERNSLELESRYKDICSRLVNLLNADQIEAARIAGCSPEIYALEWIDIYLKDKLREFVPCFEGYFKRDIDGQQGRYKIKEFS